jgi:hypothetical protein
MRNGLIIDKNETKFHYVNDQLHRRDGPAIEYADGTKIWYYLGVIHRRGGPAIEYVNGDKEWYVNGKPHRLDGPAITMEISKEWWIDGKLHRTDGPAIEYSNEMCSWYYQGDKINCNSQYEFEQWLNLKEFK